MNVFDIRRNHLSSFSWDKIRILLIFVYPFLNGYSSTEVQDYMCLPRINVREDFVPGNPLQDRVF